MDFTVGQSSFKGFHTLFIWTDAFASLKRTQHRPDSNGHFLGSSLARALSLTLGSKLRWRPASVGGVIQIEPSHLNLTLIALALAANRTDAVVFHTAYIYTLKGYDAYR